MAGSDNACTARRYRLFGSIFCAIHIALFGSSLSPAMAQTGQTMVLACNGESKYMATSAGDLLPEPLKDVGIIVNLGARTVTLSTYSTPITNLSTTLVEFYGQQTPVFSGQKLKSFTVSGTIDRVTGNTEIEWMYENVGNNSIWRLLCRPSKRMF